TQSGPRSRLQATGRVGRRRGRSPGPARKRRSWSPTASETFASSAVLSWREMVGEHCEGTQPTFLFARPPRILPWAAQRPRSAALGAGLSLSLKYLDGPQRLQHLVRVVSLFGLEIRSIPLSLRFL